MTDNTYRIPKLRPYLDVPYLMENRGEKIEHFLLADILKDIFTLLSTVPQNKKMGKWITLRSTSQKFVLTLLQSPAYLHN
jgi:hypothetical protein